MRPRVLTRLLFADEAADYKAILEVCDATETSTSSETSAMMDEMGRLGAMWEESWHANLADLQVYKVLGARLSYRSDAKQCMPGFAMQGSYTPIAVDAEAQAWGCVTVVLRC